MQDCASHFFAKKCRIIFELRWLQIRVNLRVLMLKLCYTVANEMPDSHMSQQSNLDIFDNFKAQLTWGLWSHIQLLSGWTLRNSATKRKNGISLSKPSLQPRGFTKKTSKNNMLLCKEASRRAWRVITHIARFQLFQGFDDWITCTYFQQSKGCSQPIKSPAGRFGLLIWRAKGFAHQCSKPRLFEATGRWSLVVLGHLETFPV